MHSDREQIATCGKLSGSAVERGMAWLRSSRVIYTRWLKHNRWEVNLKAPIVRRILAASLPAAIVLIEAQWKLRNFDSRRSQHEFQKPLRERDRKLFLKLIAPA